MNTLKESINNIARPRLLMNAAKELVARQRRMGITDRNFSTKRILQMVSKEQELEKLRNSKSVQYQAEDHIKILAELIEFNAKFSFAHS